MRGGDPPRRRADRQPGLGPACPRTSPGGTRSRRRGAGRGRGADRRPGQRPRPATTSSARRVPRRRGRHRHAADPLRRAGRRCAADRPRGPGLRASRRDLAVRLSRRRRRGRRSRARRAAAVDWSATGAGERLRPRAARRGAVARRTRRERSRVLVHDPARAARGARAGWPSRSAPTRATGWSVEGARPGDARAERDGFAAAYARDDAPRGRRRALLLRALLPRRCALLRAQLARGRSPRRGSSGAAAIAAVSDSILHYFLGGTADAARRASPFKNVVEAMLDLADELGLPLNLGGGVAPGDGLEEFKRGFANSAAGLSARKRSSATRRVRAPGAPARRPARFFPAYRALNG